MKEKFQRMVGRFKAVNHKNAKKNAPLQRPVQTSAPSQGVQAAADDWDMSAQDALQVGIVARYK